VARHPAGSRKLPYRIIASASLVLAMLAGLIGFAQSASAHALTLTGKAVCQQDGSYVINWNLSNDYNLDSIVHTFSVSPNVGTTNLTADASYHGGTPYLGAGTVVPANKSINFTTVGIPGTTPSVTLTVAGTWTDNFMQDTPPSYKVTLTSDCNGNLNIKKVVAGQSAPPAGTEYTIHYDNGAGTSGNVQVQGGQTVSVAKLPFGTYTLSEVSPLPGDTVTISPNPVTVSPDTRTANITVTNTFPDVGGFTVTKNVTGATGGYVAGSTFSVAYSCSNSAAGTLTLVNGATKGVSGLPIGTTCTLSEGAKPPTKDASYVWGAESWTPSSSLTIVKNASSNTVAVTLTNPLTRVLGGFTVTKNVTGATGGLVPGSTFPVSYSCSTGATGTLSLTNGQTLGVSGLPIGTTCDLSEGAKPATKDASYAWGTESWSPASHLTIVVNGSGNTVGVTLTNPLTRVLGGFNVTKNVTGATGGLVPGSTFPVDYSCSTGATGTLSLTNGQTLGVSGLPIGTTCDLSEGAKPATADASYAWGTESWSPASHLTIVVNGSGNTVAVTLTNPLVRVLGGFTVTKHVTGQTGGYVAGSSFTVSYTCTDSTTGTLTLTDGATGTVNGLPIGTQCTLAETNKPTTKDASYVWGTESFDPSNVVTIVKNDSSNTVGVILTNPLVRVEGGFTVTKHVTGETGGYVAGTIFPVNYTCSNGAHGTLNLTDGATQAVTGLPLLTTCDLSEGTKPPTKDASYAWGSETWSPSSHVTIVKNSASNVVAVVLSNPLVRVLGSFTVTKHVTGETNGYVAGSTFTVSYTCSDTSSGTLTLVDGATGTVNGLPIGTTCSLSETAKPPTTDASYAWGTPTWDPSSNVTIAVNDSDNTVGVVLDNPLTRVLGSFTVTKHVTGETAGYVSGSTFTVSYTCSNGKDGTLVLKDGQTGTVSGLPLLTTCDLSETTKPATTDASYAWGTPTWDPSSHVTIVANKTDNTVAFTLTNPLVRVLGGFTVTKHVTGETAGYVPGSTFTVSYTCTDGTTGTLTLTDGSTQGVSGLPIGTSCSLSESAKPDTRDASYAWGSETWDPSSTVTIVVNDADNTVAVVLSNPLTRVLGGFTVTKHVTGPTAGYVPGSTFTVSYTCSDGTKGALTLIDGATGKVSSLPIGTTCTLAETSKPATSGSNYTWGAEIWSPSNTVTIVANSSANTIGVNLQNPLTQVLGESVTPTTVAPAATLPVTGAPDTIYLLIIALMLMLAGGCFVVAAKVEE
jgi:large repetitive protein